MDAHYIHEGRQHSSKVTHHKIITAVNGSSYKLHIGLLHVTLKYKCVFVYNHM